MFEYNICSVFDNSIYRKQCKALEKNIPDLLDKGEIVDVDSSRIHTYNLAGKKISVHNDFQVGAVYVTSEVELLRYFE